METKLETKIRVAKWLPIKVAPKDGTRIDLWYSRAGIGYRPMGYWHKALKCWAWEDLIDGEMCVSTLPNLKPSHWTPLLKDSDEQNRL